MLSADQVFVFVDVETTGLDTRGDEIIEIAAVQGSAHNNNWTTFTALVKPTCKLPRIITSITGLTDADLENEDTIQNIFPQFMDFVGRATLRSYNAPFDGGFLKTAARRTRLKFPNAMDCVLELTRNTFPSIPSYKLDRVCHELRIERNIRHRALDDAIAAMQVFFRCHGGTMTFR